MMSSHAFDITPAQAIAIIRGFNRLRTSAYREAIQAVLKRTDNAIESFGRAADASTDLSAAEAIAIIRGFNELRSSAYHDAIQAVLKRTDNAIES